MFNAIWGYLTAALGLASVAALAWWAGRPNRARETEAAARTYFDEHGRWPEEDA
jgi:ABC-type transporter Mla subunit MlaD